MRRCWEENQYVLCPHSAVAVWHHYHCPHSPGLNRLFKWISSNLYLLDTEECVVVSKSNRLALYWTYCDKHFIQFSH